MSGTRERTPASRTNAAGTDAASTAQMPAVAGPRAVAPVLPPPAMPRLPPVQRHRLDNGLEVLLVERRELPVVDVQFVVRAGAYGDDAAHAGRAWLATDLLDQGTTTRSASQIADTAELLGASMHTRGSWDFCSAALHVLAPRLEPALELLADVVLRPTFPEHEVERKRAQRLAAILQDADDPRMLASHAFARAVYGATHPFGLPVGGTRETIARLGRDEIVEFYRTRFTADQAYVLLVGDFAADHALALIDRLFRAAGRADGGLDSGGAGGIHVVHRAGAPQSELRIGLAGPHRGTVDYFALCVANTVLGGSFTSRLNLRLREEKAYTYGAGSSFAFRAGGGPFVARTAVFTGATADAVQTVVAEMRRLGQEAVPDAELERARNYLVLGLPRTFETTGDIAEHVSDVALYGLPDDYYDRFAERVRAVTADDVTAVAQQWLRPAQLTIAIAGDAAAITTELESLGMGDVDVRDVG